MKKARASRERIVKALARLERVQLGNHHQAEQLAAAAEGMADHATKVADENRDAALAGDVPAQQRYLRALRGRAHGRRV